MADERFAVLRACQLFDEEWRVGDREKAREMAREFIAGAPDVRAALERYTRDELVHLVEEYRRVNSWADEKIVEMWLLSEYEPQHITGQFDIKLPVAAALMQGRKD